MNNNKLMFNNNFQMKEHNIENKFDNETKKKLTEQFTNKLKNKYNNTSNNYNNYNNYNNNYNNNNNNNTDIPNITIGVSFGHNRDLSFLHVFQKLYNGLNLSFAIIFKS